MRRAAALPLRVARPLVNFVVGDKVRVVRVLSGPARGSRLALDLSKEKAYWLGHYERAVQRFLQENVAPGDVVYDVGAHVGFFSVCAARLGATVYAFEPLVVNAARLERNAALNPRLEIQVTRAAAWHETGLVDLVPGDSSKEFRTVAGAGVPSIALDEFAEGERSPTLIKLDVEGAEADVLRGARRILADARPTIVCELHSEQARVDVFELLNGYRVEQLDDPSRIVAVPGRES
jgi:FkbM family methyltransferase